MLDESKFSIASRESYVRSLPNIIYKNSFLTSAARFLRKNDVTENGTSIWGCTNLSRRLAIDRFCLGLKDVKKCTLYKCFTSSVNRHYCKM